MTRPSLPSDRSVEAAVVRAVRVPSVSVAIAAVGLGAALGGSKQALGAGLGAIAIPLALTTMIAVSRRVRRQHPSALLAAAGMLFVLHATLLLLLLAVLDRTNAGDMRAFAVGAIAGIVVWQATAAVAWVRHQRASAPPSALDRL